MLNLHLLECTVKGYDHISDLLFAKYWVITGCKYENCSVLTSVYISDLKAWCHINLENPTANPLSNGAKFYLNNKEVSELVVPNDINSVKSYTFYGSKITKVTFPNMIFPYVSIGYSCFSNCDALTSVIIEENSISLVGEYAFAYCNALISVKIGNSVGGICSHAFEDCDFLISVSFPNNNDFWIGTYAFQNCDALNSITIPHGGIMDYAFQNCGALESISLGQNVRDIGAYTFNNCIALTDVYCYMTTPPYIFRTFDNISKNNCLYVPTGCSSSYRSSDWGKYFNNIVEMEE